MTIDDFIEVHPDICSLKITMDHIYPHKKLDDRVMEICDIMNTGLVFYEHRAKTLTIFTSRQYKKILDSLTPGSKFLTHDHREAVIESDKPYLVCGELCVRASIDGHSDVYDCNYFLKPII